MLTNPFGRVALATALIFAVGACSDGGSGGPDFDSEATTAETDAAGDDAAALMTDAARAIDFGGPNIFIGTAEATQRLMARYPGLAHGLGPAIDRHGFPMPGASGASSSFASGGCTVEASGSDGDPYAPYDGNENGIADDWHYKRTCIFKDTTDASNTLTQNLTFEMTVKENSASLHGFTGTLVWRYRFTDEEGFTNGVDIDATDILDIRADHAGSSYKLKVREFTTDDGTTEEVSSGLERNTTFDPDGAIVVGDALPDGALGVEGRQWFANEDHVNLSFTIHTTEALAFKSSCVGVDDPPFTAGVIVGHLNGNENAAMFQVTFTDCGAYTVDVDNTSDEPVVVTREQPRHGLAARR